jgi:hypothetical protein
MSKFSIICPESSTVEVDGKIYPCVILIGRDGMLRRFKPPSPIIFLAKSS